MDKPNTKTTDRPGLRKAAIALNKNGVRHNGRFFKTDDVERLLDILTRDAEPPPAKKSA